MSKAKTTKAAKKRSVMGLYRQIGELLNHKPKPDVKPKGDSK